MTTLTIVLGIVLSLWALARWRLLAPSHKNFSIPKGQRAGSRNTPSPENAAVLTQIQAMHEVSNKGAISQRLAQIRTALDTCYGPSISEAGLDDVQVVSVPDATPAGEWLLSPGVNPRRRLLYIHGGGFYAGSLDSHRTVAAALGKASGAAVFSLDYPRMPESTRKTMIQYCQDAIVWLADNGPDGPAAADNLMVAGDSAGGNLTLMISAWSRQPDAPELTAVVGLAPSTDATLSGASMRNHIRSDAILGPSVGWMARLSPVLRALIALIGGRINPTNPVVSPLFDHLGNLPPTLLQVSESEMLLDDAVCYANKAQQHGSQVTLQTWPGMVHVWHIFYSMIPEAEEAISKAGDFLRRHCGDPQTVEANS